MKALLWAAVSSKKQAADDKVSIQRQLELGQQHAEKWGLSVVGQLVIPGVSRSISLYDRAASSVQGYYIDESGQRSDLYVYAKLLELLELPRDDPRHVDVFIFLDRSRLGRKASLSETVIELCSENGIKAYDMESPPQTLEITRSFEERMIGAFSSQRAQREVEKLSEARDAGMVRRVQNGYFSTRIPFGYLPQYDERKNVTYIIDEEEINTVKMIQELYYDRGWGLVPIKEHLTAIGRATPGGASEWSKDTVAWLLDQSLSYAGFVEWNRTQGDNYLIAPGRQPAIISEERARAILAERMARAGARRSVGAVYRFSRMVRCAECDTPCATAAGWVVKKLTDSITSYYREQYICRQHSGASYRNIHAKMVEVIEKLSDPIYFDEMVGQEKDSTAALKNELVILYKQAEDIEEKLRLAEELLFNKDISIDRYRARKADFNEKLTTLENHITQLERQLEIAEQQSKRVERINEVRQIGLDMLTTEDVRTGNAWLRRFFRIYVAHGKIRKIIIL